MRKKKRNNILNGYLPIVLCNVKLFILFSFILINIYSMYFNFLILLDFYFILFFLYFLFAIFIYIYI